jgi:hypothetical protein
LVIVQKEIAHAGTLPLTVPHAQVLPPQLLAQLPLPAGYRIADDWQAFRAGTITINWDSARDIPLMAVSGSPPTTVPRVEPAAAWVQFLATVFPWAQIGFGAFVFAFAVVARAGFGHGLGNPR